MFNGNGTIERKSLLSHSRGFHNPSE
jgi:hypothetical protein